MRDRNANEIRAAVWVEENGVRRPFGSRPDDQDSLLGIALEDAGIFATLTPAGPEAEIRGDPIDALGRLMTSLNRHFGT